MSSYLASLCSQTEIEVMSHVQLSPLCALSQVGCTTTGASLQGLPKEIR